MGKRRKPANGRHLVSQLKDLREQILLVRVVEQVDLVGRLSCELTVGVSIESRHHYVVPIDGKTGDIGGL